jgi:choline dehydrogenase-like flavoprotein
LTDLRWGLANWAQMATSLIIGSGPAAAGAAAALLRDPNQSIVILDVGATLDEDRLAVVRKMSSQDETAWSQHDLGVISQHAIASEQGALPEKRTYGSNYPFRDSGQLQGVKAIGNANRSVISGAYGGFSNLWGAQIMPFSAATFERWPIKATEMEDHYRFALGEMVLAGDVDDLSDVFPLITEPRPLPRLSERAMMVLDRYEARRAYIQSMGITLGRARLAFQADSCTRCGLCMTGCPHGLIYSASQTFDRLRKDKRVTYVGGVLALEISEENARPKVLFRNLRTGEMEHRTADRVFIACGGIGSARLVLGSLKHFNRPVSMGESVQFVLPAMSRQGTADPRHQDDFTLNQFNLLYDSSGDGFDLSQIHFYPFNPVFETSLPKVLQMPGTDALRRWVLRRLSVGLGYIPSWASPRVLVTARPGPDSDLPNLEVDREASSGWPDMLRELIRVLTKVAPALDLWPALPMISVSGAAKSYHFGGAFPHGAVREGLQTDRLGRLRQWDNVHLVDASVFPNVPATTFTLTIMANAHRIATESLR